MDRKIYNAIDGFLTELAKFSPKVITEISEVSYDNTIMIYHNYVDADIDDAFITKSIELQDKYFWDNNIINVGFAFNYELYNSLMNIITIDYTQREPSNIVYIYNYMNQESFESVLTFESGEYLGVAA